MLLPRHSHWARVQPHSDQLLDAHGRVPLSGEFFIDLGHLRLVMAQRLIVAAELFQNCARNTRSTEASARVAATSNQEFGLARTECAVVLRVLGRHNVEPLRARDGHFFAHGLWCDEGHE